MKKSRFSEEQIIRILEEGKSGLNIDELCRKYGIAKPTYYTWKAKFGGMTVSEAQRLRALEEENSKLKRLVAEYALDIVALKDVLSKKW
jgi:putative transposase